jgi:hypothetical protein
MSIKQKISKTNSRSSNFEIVCNPSWKQCELEKLQNVKKACLEKMFV